MDLIYRHTFIVHNEVKEKRIVDCTKGWFDAFSISAELVEVRLCTFGEHILSYLSNRLITQRDFAEEIGIGRDTLAKAIAGKRISFKTKRLIVEKIGLDYVAFIKEQEKENETARIDGK